MRIATSNSTTFSLFVSCFLTRVRALWWRYQMETFSALLALCAGNSPVTGDFPAQRPVTRSFDVFFYLRQNKRMSKQPWGWWFETPSWSLWRHCNVVLHNCTSPAVYLQILCVAPVLLNQIVRTNIVRNKHRHSGWSHHNLVIAGDEYSWIRSEN